MKQLLILSGKGGTGKTTVAGAFIHLARAKAYADCDVDAPNLHLILRDLKEPDREDFYGMEKALIHQEDCIACGLCKEHCRFHGIVELRERENHPRYEVNPYTCEGCGVCERLCPQGAITLQPDPAGELRLYSNEEVFSTAELKMGSGTSGLLVTEVKKRLKGAVKDQEFAIIDGSPGIGCPVIASISGVDLTLVVAEPSIAGISDMKRILETAKKFNCKTAVCVNKFDTNEENTNRIEAFCREHHIGFTGKIPYDPQAVKAINRMQSIAEVDCPSGEAVRRVYRQTMKILMNEKVV